MKFYTKLIDITLPKNVLKYYHLQCNCNEYIFTNFPEIKYIESYLSDLKPTNILDIGSGIGRASVFFFKYFNWDTSTFYLFDGNRGESQICGLQSDISDGYYNSLDCTKKFCLANGMNNFNIINAENVPNKLPKFDLIYSFLSIGFHFNLSLYLNEWLYHLLSPNALLIFGIRGKEHHEWNVQQIENIDKNKFNIIKIHESENNKIDRTSILILQYKNNK